MLDVNFEFVRGILFVRLEGVVNNDTTCSIKKNLVDIISKGGIKYLVFNINNAILEDNLSLFDICNTLIKENNGKMYLCGLKNKIESVISSNFNYCEKINSELSVLKKISVC